MPLVVAVYCVLHVAHCLPVAVLAAYHYHPWVPFVKGGHQQVQERVKAMVETIVKGLLVQVL